MTTSKVIPQFHLVVLFFSLTGCIKIDSDQLLNSLMAEALTVQEVSMDRLKHHDKEVTIVGYIVSIGSSDELALSSEKVDRTLCHADNFEEGSARDILVKLRSEPVKKIATRAVQDRLRVVATGTFFDGGTGGLVLSGAPIHAVTCDGPFVVEHIEIVKP